MAKLHAFRMPEIDRDATLTAIQAWPPRNNRPSTPGLSRDGSLSSVTRYFINSASLSLTASPQIS